MVQKAEIGVHCQMKTMIMEKVKATTKIPQYIRMRRNWTIGKIRYWNKMLPISCIRRCKIVQEQGQVSHGVFDARHSKSICELEGIVVLKIREYIHW